MKKTAGILIIAFCVLFVSTLAFAKANYARNERGYTVVSVEQNDSLWSIASSFRSSDKEVREFVKELIKFNKLDTDTLVVGQKIIVPLGGVN